MYEITHKGAWFKWGALDRTEKALVVVTALTAIPPGFLLGRSERLSYRIGYFLGNGEWPQAARQPAVLPDAWLGPVTLFTIACAIVCGLAWWRFSLRQDEMFNRVQNEAIGRGSAWALAVAALWWMLTVPGWVAPLPVSFFLTVALFLMIAFWFRAASRWA